MASGAYLQIARFGQGWSPSRRSPRTGRPTRLQSLPLRQSERAIKRPKRNLPPVPPVESLRSRAYKASGLAGFHVQPGNVMTSSGVNLRHLKNTIGSKVANENAVRAAATQARRDAAARRIQRLWRSGTAKAGLKGRYMGHEWAYGPNMIRQMNKWTKALNEFNRAVAGTRLEQWYRTNPNVQQLRSNLRNRRLTNATGHLLTSGFYPKKNKYTFQNVIQTFGLERMYREAPGAYIQGAHPGIQEVREKAARTIERYRRAQVLKRELARLVPRRTKRLKV